MKVGETPAPDPVACGGRDLAPLLDVRTIEPPEPRGVIVEDPDVAFTPSSLDQRSMQHELIRRPAGTSVEARVLDVFAPLRKPRPDVGDRTDPEDARPGRRQRGVVADRYFTELEEHVA